MFRLTFFATSLFFRHKKDSGRQSIYTKKELLDGDNKVFDEKLNQKVEAYKGTSMTKLPYVLTLAFKRFEFDFATLQRSKVNDRVEFPYVIDMNQW